MPCLKQTSTLGIVATISVITLEEMDRTKEDLAAEATAIAMTIREINQLLIIHLRKNKRWLSFQTHNHQKRTSNALPSFCTDKNYYIYTHPSTIMGMFSIYESADQNTSHLFDKFFVWCASKLKIFTHHTK